MPNSRQMKILEETDKENPKKLMKSLPGVVGS
jgi:hypothetical protein